MSLLTRKRAQMAMERTPWDLSNKILYDMCKSHPLHVEQEAIITKVIMIGRVYAAAIERRRNKGDEGASDDFYIDEVAPAIQNSDIDTWINEARSSRLGSPSALATLVEVHGRTTDLFSKISGLKKRSLASKYLHFHVPNLFYIYDSRAVESLRKFSSILPRASRSPGRGDDEYRKFATKCDLLREVCEEKYSLRLLPRHIDNMLLRV